MPRDGYDPTADPDLDDEQRADVLEPIKAWFAFYRDPDDLADLEQCLPDAEDRWRLIRLWAYCNDKVTNGIVPDAAALRILGDQARRDRLIQAGVLQEDGDALRVRDFLRMNRTRAQAGEAAATRSAQGAIGGRRSGEARRGIRERRKTAESGNEAQEPHSSGKRTTDTGTGRARATDANADAAAAPPSGDPAAARGPPLDVAADAGWTHIDPDDLKNFHALQKLHARVSRRGVVDADELGLFELACAVVRARRLGDNPPAYLASYLQRWKDEVSGVLLSDMDRNQALDWLARADKALARRVVEGLRQRSLSQYGVQLPDDRDEPMARDIEAEFQRRLEIVRKARAQ